MWLLAFKLRDTVKPENKKNKQKKPICTFVALKLQNVTETTDSHGDGVRSNDRFRRGDSGEVTHMHSYASLVSGHKRVSEFNIVFSRYPVSSSCFTGQRGAGSMLLLLSQTAFRHRDYQPDRSSERLESVYSTSETGEGAVRRNKVLLGY